MKNESQSTMSDLERLHMYVLAIFVKILGLVIFGCVPLGAFIWYLINAVQKNWLVSEEEVMLTVFSGALTLVLFLTIIPTIIFSLREKEE